MIFTKLYQTVLGWSRNQKAPYFLAGVSFAESSFFPIPPDVMLISMGLVKPKSVWYYAFITTLFSVLGGILGYCIGLFSLHLFLPIIKSAGYYGNFVAVQNYFKIYGIWFIFVAGFTPIPYKLFTIAAGAMTMPLIPFVLGSMIGRGMRFYLVSGLLYFQGEKIEKHLSKHVEWIGWLVLILIVIVLCIVRVW